MAIAYLLTQIEYWCLEMHTALERDFNLSVSTPDVLVVVSDLLGIGEPAATAGFPTAFVKRVDSRNAKFQTTTMSPTYEVSTFGSLVPILHDPISAPIPPEPQEPQYDSPAYRFLNCYQAEYFLGRGSQGMFH